MPILEIVAQAKAHGVVPGVAGAVMDFPAIGAVVQAGHQHPLGIVGQGEGEFVRYERKQLGAWRGFFIYLLRYDIGVRHAKADGKGGLDDVIPGEFGPAAHHRCREFPEIVAAEVFVYPEFGLKLKVGVFHDHPAAVYACQVFGYGL